MPEPDDPRPVRAVITGATGTVGRACAEALGRRGCALTLVGRREPALDALATELSGPGRARPDVVLWDQRRPLDWDVPARWRSERLVLVNAAAVFGPLTAFTDADEDEWVAAVESNFIGAARLIHRLLPIMIEQHWGRVVQISSAAARGRAEPFNTAYAVSKTATDRLVASLAVETAGTGVTVCSLHPGEIASAMRDDIAERAGRDDRLAGWTSWADRTAASGDDPVVAAEWVAGLLDDEVAVRFHGRFAYPQDDGRSDPL